MDNNETKPTFNPLNETPKKIVLPEIYAKNINHRHRRRTNHHQFLSHLAEGATSKQAGDLLGDQILALMSKLSIPNGLKNVGVTHNDIPNLVEGTLPQHRVIKLSPKLVSKKDLY